jgi:uncharacterized membrane protein required for colicin V production
MGILIDLIIIGIIALCTFIGYKRGLIKVAIRIFSFFIAIIIALILYRPVTAIVINHTSIGNNIEGRILTSILPEDVDPDDTVLVDDSVSSLLGGVLETTGATIAQTLTLQIVETVVLLGIFVIVKIALRFITALTDLITNLPILKQFNELRRTYIRTNTRFPPRFHNACRTFSFVPSNRRHFYK